MRSPHALTPLSLAGAHQPAPAGGSDAGGSALRPESRHPLHDLTGLAPSSSSSPSFGARSQEGAGTLKTLLEYCLPPKRGLELWKESWGSPALSLGEGTTEMPPVPGSSLRSGGAQLLCAFFGVSLHEAKPGVLPSLWCHLCVTCWHQDRPRGYCGLYPGFLESRCAGRLAAAGGDAALGPRPQISASHPGKARRGVRRIQPW